MNPLNIQEKMNHTVGKIEEGEYIYSGRALI